MVLIFKDLRLTSLDDLQKFSVKNLRDLLGNHPENTGGVKAVLVLKCYALLMRHVLPDSQNAENQNDQYTSYQKGLVYRSVLQRVSPLGWSTDLRQLPELSFIQLYDYLVVST